MPDILIRGLAPRTVKRLKDNARRNGRSLQCEAKLLLERAAAADRAAVARVLAGWKARFGGRGRRRRRRRFSSSSVELIREGRER